MTKQLDTMANFDRIEDYILSLGFSRVDTPNCECLGVGTLYTLVPYNGDKVARQFKGQFLETLVKSVKGAHCLAETLTYYITLAPNSYDYAFIDKVLVKPSDIKH